MTMIRVNVTQEDIENGENYASDSSLCPIAQALKPMLKSGVTFSVGYNSIHMGNDDGDNEWSFDEQIPFQLNSNHEDHSGFTTDDLEPFSFNMRMPGHYFENEYCDCGICMGCDDDCDCGCNDRDDEEEDDNDDDNPQDEDQRPYTVNFLKNANGNFHVRDRDGDIVILTVEQIEKLYRISRSTVQEWALL